MEFIIIWNGIITAALFFVYIKAYSAKNMADIVSRDLEEVEQLLSLK